jgi:5-hydroxyisourate hydrolase-like protein (transthyretin family)
LSAITLIGLTALPASAEPTPTPSPIPPLQSTAPVSSAPLSSPAGTSRPASTTVPPSRSPGITDYPTPSATVIPTPCDIIATTPVVTVAPPVVAPPSTPPTTGCISAVKGQVLDATTPVAGVQVQLVLSAYEYIIVGRATTGADGRFRIGNVRVTATYRLKFILPGGLVQYYPGQSVFSQAAVLAIPARNEVELTEQVVLPHGSLVGHVTKADGSPAANITVTLGRNTGGGIDPVGTATTDPAGSYVFTYAPAGEWYVYFAASNRGNAPVQ